MPVPDSREWCGVGLHGGHSVATKKQAGWEGRGKRAEDYFVVTFGAGSWHMDRNHTTFSLQ